MKNMSKIRRNKRNTKIKMETKRRKILRKNIKEKKKNDDDDNNKTKMDEN